MRFMSTETPRNTWNDIGFLRCVRTMTTLESSNISSALAKVHARTELTEKDDLSARSLNINKLRSCLPVESTAGDVWHTCTELTLQALNQEKKKALRETGT